MKKIVGLCGNINSGRATLALGLVTDGWHVYDVKADVESGTDPVVALQKVLVAAQDLDVDIAIAGLTDANQLQIIHELGGFSVFVERPGITDGVGSEVFRFELQRAYSVCRSCIFNVKDILIGQAELKQFIEEFFTPVV